MFHAYPISLLGICKGIFSRWEKFPILPIDLLGYEGYKLRNIQSDKDCYVSDRATYPPFLHGNVYANAACGSPACLQQPMLPVIHPFPERKYPK